MDDAGDFQLVSIIHSYSLVGGDIDESDVGKGGALVLVGKVDVLFCCVVPMDVGVLEGESLPQLFNHSTLSIVLENVDHVVES